MRLPRHQRTQLTMLLSVAQHPSKQGVEAWLGMHALCKMVLVELARLLPSLPYAASVLFAVVTLQLSDAGRGLQCTCLQDPVPQPFKIWSCCNIRRHAEAAHSSCGPGAMQQLSPCIALSIASVNSAPRETVHCSTFSPHVLERTLVNFQKLIKYLRRRHSHGKCGDRKLHEL